MTPIKEQDIPERIGQNTEKLLRRKKELIKFMQSGARLAELERMSKKAGDDRSRYLAALGKMGYFRRFRVFVRGDRVFIQDYKKRQEGNT